MIHGIDENCMLASQQYIQGRSPLQCEALAEKARIQSAIAYGLSYVQI